VANQRAAKPLASKAVFVNCPFDEEFKPIFRARRVRNWLSEHRSPNEPPLLGAVAILSDYRKFQANAGALLSAQRFDPLDDLTHNDFLFTVRDWMTTRA